MHSSLDVSAGEPVPVVVHAKRSGLDAVSGPRFQEQPDIPTNQGRRAGPGLVADTGIGEHEQSATQQVDRPASANDRVVFQYSFPPDGTHYPEENVLAVQKSVAIQIARITGHDFGGVFSNSASTIRARPYFVPNEALTTPQASALGILDENDLFGGVVPHEFVRTKAITHGLVNEQARRPHGWSLGFTDAVSPVVLAGRTAFSLKDAHLAGFELLRHGSVRLKKPTDSGSEGQLVITTPRELGDALDHFDDDFLAINGLVLEVNLHDVTTFTVGRVNVSGMVLSYYGRQSMTINNGGEAVYGGADLICVKGGWEELQRLQTDNIVRFLIEKVIAYDRALDKWYSIIASRRNYDVGIGLDDSGHFKAGVFEASLRPGGASPAELAALAEFAMVPSCHTVQVSSITRFGKNLECAPAAILSYLGDDPVAGPMMRYAVVTDIRREL